jgi:MoxR-like ATPase
MPSLLKAGWALERSERLRTSLDADSIREMSRRVLDVDLTPVANRFADLVFRTRDLGVALSDRRAVKVQKLVAASAVLCQRALAADSDLWVFRHLWDREEQIAPLTAMVNGVLKEAASVPVPAVVHPRAAVPERIDAESIARELEMLEREAGASARSLLALARLREQAGLISDRIAWVSDAAKRRHLNERATALLHRIGN